jgi:microcystin-dependent protein
MDNIYNYFEILIVLILIYYVYQKLKKEKFTTPSSITNSVEIKAMRTKNILLFDIEEIKEFINGDKFKNLEHFLNNYNKSNDQLIDYTVNIGYKNYKGDIYIENMNNDIYNIYPKGAVLFINIDIETLNKYKTIDNFNHESFYMSGEIPKEYIVANGKTIWYKHEDKTINVQFIDPVDDSFIKFTPPNLINKFLLGYDHRNRNTTFGVNKKNIYQTGGETFVKINETHLPQHKHTININANNENLKIEGKLGASNNLLYLCNNNCTEKISTKYTQYKNPSSGTMDTSLNEIRHNNIPPYVELIPIIKFI